MKDVLISSTISMSDDSFASESLITECVLSSNEISYSLKSLINIEAADYSFIDEVITQIVCDQLQIKSLTLIKAKSIREFDDHYAKKLITHVIYSNLTVQNHTIDTASMLITWLDQHQMILEKTWMNKINLVINMQIDFLRFSNFISSQKSIVLLSSHKTITKQKSLTFTHILKRSFTFVTSQFSQKSLSFSQKKSSTEQLKSRDATLTNVKISKSTSGSTNIAIIETATYKMFSQMFRCQDLCCYHLENRSTHNYSWKQVWRSESAWAFSRWSSRASQDQAFLWISRLSKHLRLSNDWSAILASFLRSQNWVDWWRNILAKQTISDVQSQASEDKEVSDQTSEQRVHFLQLRIIHLAHLVRWKERRKSAFLRWLQKAQCFD